ncbi:hypothetical protein SteCoe_30741 [Stentor coeruleus]|uniref:NOT2/NOT3/NOT5 C-terminal domain-containing protein n=1 Tax=Stentor coeruleus TaxID=5963 RepID=A0A1R2B3C9_9CILI|nr:hypothetical protein SteCoe_30741 [Stentor coeruleus]
MYNPNRSTGYFETIRNAENLRKVPSFDPDSKNQVSFPPYYDGYSQIYAPKINIDYNQNYQSGVEYQIQEEFPSLLNSKPPGFTNEDFTPPPGFSKPLKTKAPNPNAVSFIPSFLSSVPLKSEKDEQESKDFGVRGILNLQKTLDKDKDLLAKGKDLSSMEIGKKNQECFSSFINHALTDNDIEDPELPEYNLPISYYIAKPILRFKMIKSYHIETLFYVFYNIPGEIVQSYVADELYRRDWVYEPVKQQWFINIGGEWKTFDVSRFEIISVTFCPGPFLSKDDVNVKQKPLA